MFNYRHIKSHLEGEVEVDESQMTAEQLQFHYFTMHDLNKDSKLDGLELIKAITHWHGGTELLSAMQKILIYSWVWHWIFPWTPASLICSCVNFGTLKFEYL